MQGRSQAYGTVWRVVREVELVIKEAIATGDTVQEAYENACKQLGVGIRIWQSRKSWKCQ